MFAFILAPMIQLVSAQGFINLNFESANVAAYSPGPATVLVASAVPGWTVYVKGVAQSNIIYNDISLGAPEVSIHDTNDVFAPVQGAYFILLQSSTAGDVTGSSAIGQTGTIPLSTMSLTFWGNFDGQVTFDSQLLTYTAIGTTPNYSIYQADISAYAGITGQLLFSAPYGTGGIIDNIQFSSLPVPEPSGLLLAVLGTGLIGLLRLRRSRARQ